MIPVTSASPRQHVSRMCPWLRTVDPIRRYARPAGPDSAACGGRQM